MLQQTLDYTFLPWHEKKPATRSTSDPANTPAYTIVLAGDEAAPLAGADYLAATCLATSSWFPQQRQDDSMRCYDEPPRLVAESFQPRYSVLVPFFPEDCCL